MRVRMTVPCRKAGVGAFFGMALACGVVVVGHQAVASDEHTSATRPVAASRPAEGKSPWTAEQIAHYSRKFAVHDLPGSLHYHFPRRSFIQYGYCPPGGYVKDFSMYRHEGRWHLFHIDGRPGEICWITGNEISFGHASTDDFQHWIRHRMPLAVGQRQWENYHIWAPYVCRLGEQFYMFYMGSGHEGSYISYATSDDLERWQRWAEGPIREAMGRDPYIFEHEGRTILAYTSNLDTGDVRLLGACATTDLNDWTALPPILENPGGCLESASIHPCKKGYILWFNEWGGNVMFRAAYAFSDDPLHFDAGKLRTFAFECGPDDTPEDPVFKKVHRQTRPVPTSIELLQTSDDLWLVAYFRMVGNGFRLFFGEMDWRTDPITIREINTPQHLRKVLEQVRGHETR